jgi:hypothetical protein
VLWHWLQLVIMPAGVIWWFPVSAQYVVWLQELVGEKAAAVEWQFAQFTGWKAGTAAATVVCTGLVVPL